MEITFLTISALLFLTGTVYFLFAGMLYLGFKRLPKYSPVIPGDWPRISIVICARNEALLLPRLLDDIVQQDYPKSKLELIVVDDVSEDDTADIVSRFAQAHTEIRTLLVQRKNGVLPSKKSALMEGVSSASNGLILTTDADCSVGPQWIRVMIATWLNSGKRMLCGPVMYRDAKSIFEKFQSLEFHSLMVSGAGMIGWNRPVMANAANMLYIREDFIDCVKNKPLAKLASGDDAQLLFSVAHAHGNDAVGFVSNPLAIVSTHPMADLRGFFSQRVRWASKTGAYREVMPPLMAVFVFLYCLVLLLSPLSIFFHWSFACLFSSLFTAKCIADYPLMNSAVKFTGQHRLMYLYLPLQFIYPLYIVISALGGIFGGFSWKGRKYLR